MTHNELAARIERAEGPEIGELECVIADLIDIWPKGEGWLRNEYVHDGAKLVNYYNTHLLGQYMPAPQFLHSIDVAMQLADGMTPAQIWDIWHRALRDCSRAGADLRTDLARFLSAAAIRARSAS